MQIIYTFYRVETVWIVIVVLQNMTLNDKN